MKTLHQIAAAVALCVAGTMPAFAQGTTFTNGSFDAGLLTPGWTKEGDVTVLGSRKVAALTTASFDFEDDFDYSDPMNPVALPAGFLNLTGENPVDTAAGLGGVSQATLDSFGFGTAFEGSAIRQDFTAFAGDQVTVSFNWAFYSVDMDFQDFAFLAVNDTVISFVDTLSTNRTGFFNGDFVDGAGDIYTFEQRAGLDGILGNEDDPTMAWNWVNFEYTYTAAVDGAVSLVVGVVDVGDFTGTSELRVDNFSVSAVPEPETYAMLLAGLGLMGAIARRRRS